ncbi:hypothetical protein Calab_2073 [Caldithrix abyssi DSM 13497]|uniref:Por secretion system C-terminal sorting domain-containing protein n=1 Tax=Caldithrix abyssi DSM 13497 TaxID=880073 RepID=H1XVC7_CALAY|nr:hypothetical protein [Caldithrix abyssi]APF17593.1 hypothetical protein Cabys_842 [Caldithrix abyssi DSM 13497]EHO41685.1 hypothetical protein Calab_2073 [Caldithrix abyssi DSM 13497]
MNKRISRLLLIVLIFGFMAILVQNEAFARPKYNEVSTVGLSKITATKITQTMSNIGNWGFWVNYEGQTGHDPFTGSSGGYYPRGAMTAIYMDGIIWGAYLVDPNTGIAIADTPRVGGIGYRIGTTPGWVIGEGENAVSVSAEDERVRIYRIRHDWRSLTASQVLQDAAELNNVPITGVTDAMTTAIIEQYKEDWKNWPVDLGAPYYDVNGNGQYDPVLDENGYPDETKGDYPGLAQADQVIWLVVNDLNEAKVRAHSGTFPIGLELQITLWAYNQPNNTLGQIVFKRYKLINKSGMILDSMFVAQYSDPDIGDYTDDLVGCDTTLSLHFAYNGPVTDAEYNKVNLPPAAAGFDFFQGPLIESPGDTGVFNLQYIPDHKNLPMTSFGYFAAGGDISDPPMGVIDFTLQWYNMLNGNIPTNDLNNPTPYVYRSGPNKDQPTKFPLSGDPVTDPNAVEGDIDGQGDNMGPGDRRMFAATGPFTMQPGDEQEIVVALIGGLGGNNIQSVADLKSSDIVAQKVYDNLFQIIPKPPTAPNVKAIPMDDKVVLNWGWDVDRIKDTEERKIINYEFEGYNVYQLPSATAKLNDPQTVRIATFDKINDVRIIKSSVFSAEYGTVVDLPIQFGSDTGIKRFFVVDKDYITGKPLYRGTTYYFAVTAYNYDGTLVRDRALESSPIIHAVTVQDPKPGYRYEGEPGEMVEVVKNGNDDGVCQVIVVDPTATTGHDYEIYFEVDEDTNSVTYGQTVWNLKDVTTGEVVLAKQPQSPDPAANDQLIVDGLLIKVSGPAPGIKAIVQVADDQGPLTPDEYDAAGAPFGGNNVWHSLSSPNDPNRFYISAGGGDGGIERMSRSIANAQAHDFEMRFTDAGGTYTWWYDADTAAHVPFEAWDVGILTYDDPSDDIRMLTGGYSGGATVGSFDFGYTDPAFGFPATDWVYFRKPMNDQGTYEAYENDVLSGAFTYNWWFNSYEVLARIIICDFGGAGTLPPTGTVIRWVTNKPHLLTTTYSFTAPAAVYSDDLAKVDVEKVNVFPNPYYAANSLEPDRFNRFVTFNHLPKHAIIRIFTLGGVQVRKLEKNDDSQFLQWDLKNETGLPVASGMYIAYVDMPELGKTKTLKLMIIQGEQVVEFY